MSHIVKIYCLIDPRTNNPFYVGRTARKRLISRLHAHVADSKWKGRISKKSKIIREIIQETSKRPIISTVFVTTHELAPLCEKAAYDYLTNRGFTLSNNSNLFNYGKDK